MAGPRIRDRLRTSELGELDALLGRTGAHLPDQLTADLTAPRPGFVAVLVGEDGGPLRGYAQASTVGPAAWQIAVVPETSAEALDGLLDELRRRGGGTVTWWTSTPAAPPLAAHAGLTPGRGLLHLRVELPLTGVDDTLATRPFRPGTDEVPWLAVNAAAFATHPEQGGWDLATLRQRQAEPWWDPAGFLIYEEHGAMVGFCWTKIHRDITPPHGEIYVIGVAPGAHGRGLGRALTVAGLASLSRRGIRHGMLFVDLDNAAAVGLYRSLGFTTARTEQAYTARLEPT